MARFGLGSVNAKIMIDTSSTAGGNASVTPCKTNWTFDDKPVESAPFFVNDFRINRSNDCYDVTSFADTSKTMVAGLPTTTFTLEGVFTEGQDWGIFEKIRAGKMKLVPADYSSSGAWHTIEDTQAATTEEEHKRMELWEYAVTYQPRDDAGDIIQDSVTILTQPTVVLGQSESKVQKQAIAELTDTKSLNLDYVLVHVRPFGYGS